MPTLIPETTLPNGMKIFCIREEEVPIIYEQIQQYFKHGVKLQEGDTVFDVGANIGLFTLWLYQLCKTNVNIYAFEPIPAIFDVLHANAQRFGPEKLRVFPCGLSRESKTIMFAYYPNATPLSSAYPDGSKQQRDKFKNIILRNVTDAPTSVRWLRWLPPALRSLILDRILEKAFQMEQVACQLRTVSEIIREYAVEQIDLLKVDVERSELDVLLGIEEQDWPKIKQVVVEVHDLDFRVDKMTALLKEQGLSEIIVEQEPLREGSDTFNLYALRR
ncbi:MAG: FkbM family methyltransferase [Brasilonema angustatum HA4187-MV1]|jgi:FkbM family methyltransferase|nr:FkbM family methyltransferase [Brasilonema angustatum HA4187-MV1]